MRTLTSVPIGMHMSELTRLLEIALLAKRLRLYLQHDQALQHFNCSVKVYLFHHFSGRWIGRGSNRIGHPYMQI